MIDGEYCPRSRNRRVRSQILLSLPPPQPLSRDRSHAHRWRKIYAYFDSGLAAASSLRSANDPPTIGGRSGDDRGHRNREVRRITHRVRSAVPHRTEPTVGPLSMGFPRETAEADAMKLFADGAIDCAVGQLIDEEIRRPVPRYFGETRS